MSGEQPDESQRTEEATEHRLQKEMEKGNVTLSREFVHFAIFISAAIISLWVAPYMSIRLMGFLKDFVSMPDQMDMSPFGIKEALQSVFINVFYFLLPIFFITYVIVIAVSLAQSRLKMSVDAITPKLERLGLSNGLKRIFSTRALVEFLKGVIKVVVLGWIIFWYLKDPIIEFLNSPRSQSYFFFYPLKGFLMDVFRILIISLLTISGFDYLYQKFEYLKSLRMSRQEIKDEMKDLDGDPEVKGRLKRMRYEMSKRRVAAEVPKATAILTNPTHYSVAIRYVAEEMEAPVVIAKGQDHLAFKIREIAKQHDIPIIETPELARALYKVDVNQMIPPEHYRAVAEIIRVIMKRKQNLF